MENGLAIIGKSSADLAELMGMSNVPARSTSALAEIKQVHQNVMGTKKVDGEMMEVAIATPAEGPSFGVAPSGTCT